LPSASSGCLRFTTRGDVLDDNLYTAPGKFGGGGAGTTWLVGSAADVARSLRRYQDLGITHFVLSDSRGTSALFLSAPQAARTSNNSQRVAFNGELHP